DLVGFLKFALGNVGDEAGNINIHRAAGAAGVVFALQAALGLVHGHFSGVAQGHFLEVLVADVGLLAGHGAFFRFHFGHDHCTSCFSRLHWASRAWASKGLYIVPRCMASSKSTSKPSKSGPSTQANLVLPPTVRRQPPHIPVPSTMMGFMETTVLTLWG